METLLDTSKAVPVSGNVLIDKKKIMELVDQLRLAIPQEVKAAAEVLSQKDHIINQANLDARRTKAQAEDDYRERLDQNEITELAQKRAEETLSEAEERANRIIKQTETDAKSRLVDADAYALRSLRALERQLNNITESVRKGIDMLAEETVVAPTATTPPIRSNPGGTSRIKLSAAIPPKAARLSRASLGGIGLRPSPEHASGNVAP